MRDDTAMNNFLNTLPGWLIELRKMQEAKTESKAQRETQASQFREQMGFSKDQFKEMKSQFTQNLAGESARLQKQLSANLQNTLTGVYGADHPFEIGEDMSIGRKQESYPDISPTGDIGGSYGMSGTGNMESDLRRMADIQSAKNRGYTTQQVQGGVPMATPPTLAQLAAQASMGHERGMQGTGIASQERMLERNIGAQQQATASDQAFQTSIMNQQYQNELGKMGAGFGYQQQAAAGEQGFQTTMQEAQNQQQREMSDKQYQQQIGFMKEQPDYPVKVSGASGAINAQTAFQHISTFPNRIHKTNGELVKDIENMYELATQYQIQIPDYVLKSIKSRTKKVTGWGGSGDYFGGTKKSIRRTRKQIEDLNRSLAGAAGLLQQPQ